MQKASSDSPCDESYHHSAPLRMQTIHDLIDIHPQEMHQMVHLYSTRMATTWHGHADMQDYDTTWHNLDTTWHANGPWHAKFLRICSHETEDISKKNGTKLLLCTHMSKKIYARPVPRMYPIFCINILYSGVQGDTFAEKPWRGMTRNIHDTAWHAKKYNMARGHPVIHSASVA